LALAILDVPPLKCALPILVKVLRRVLVNTGAMTPKNH
jgi:hypothetical protein